MTRYESLFFELVLEDKSRFKMDENKFSKPLPFNEGDR